MPVHLGKDTKGCYAQWGNQKKYYYPCGNKQARDKAKQKAYLQGYVITGGKGEAGMESYFRKVLEKSHKDHKFSSFEQAMVRAIISKNKLWTEEDWKEHDKFFEITEQGKPQDKPGGTNVGKYRTKGPFCGPSGGAPPGSFPVNTRKRAIAALAYARNAPNPAGIRKCVCQHWPKLPACGGGKKK